MDYNFEFSSDGNVFVSFGIKSCSDLAKKSFVLNVENMYKCYLSMDKVKILQSRLRSSVKRYDFLKEYISPQTQYIDESFILDRDVTELDYLDRVTSSLSYFIILHSICKVKPNEYNSMYEKSSTYDEFITNYIEFARTWCVGKNIEKDVMGLITKIEENYSLLKQVLIKTTTVHSVFENYNIGINIKTASVSDYVYLAGALLVFLLAIVIIFFLWRKFS